MFNSDTWVDSSRKEPQPNVWVPVFIPPCHFLSYFGYKVKFVKISHRTLATRRHSEPEKSLRLTVMPRTLPLLHARTRTHTHEKRVSHFVTQFQIPLTCILRPLSGVRECFATENPAVDAVWAMEKPHARSGFALTHILFPEGSHTQLLQGNERSRRCWRSFAWGSHEAEKTRRSASKAQLPWLTHLWAHRN